MSSIANAISFADTNANPELHVLGDVIRPLVTPIMGGRLELFDLRGVAGNGPVPHAHPWDEAYVILDGTVAIIEGNSEREVGPGDSVMIPADTVHAYRITSDQARFLVATTGHGLGSFFTDVDTLVKEMPRDLGTLVEVAKRNGLTSPLFP